MSARRRKTVHDTCGERERREERRKRGLTKGFKVLLNCLQVTDCLAHMSRVVAKVTELHVCMSDEECTVKCSGSANGNSMWTTNESNSLM